MRRLAALVLAVLLTGCAITRSPASDAAVADVATTGLGLVAGAVELNPLGLALIPVKLALLAHVETMPAGEKQATQTMMAAVWNGAAVNNVCVIGVILTSGAASLPCLLVGGAYGVWEYTTTKANQMQQEFAALCVQARESNPRMKCFYKGQQI